MKICVFQNSLELESISFIKYQFQPMVYIYASIWFPLFRRWINTQIVLIFMLCLFRVSFPFINNGWMINVANITSCILLKQQSRGIIIVIVVLRRGFIPKRSTRINLLWGICNWMNWGTAAHYIITIIYIDSMCAVLEYQGHILQVLRRLFTYHKTFWWIIWH